MCMHGCVLGNIYVTHDYSLKVIYTRNMHYYVYSTVYGYVVCVVNIYVTFVLNCKI